LAYFICVAEVVVIEMMSSNISIFDPFLANKKIHARARNMYEAVCAPPEKNKKGVLVADKK
jgi:hypothetical protein